MPLLLLQPLKLSVLLLMVLLAELKLAIIPPVSRKEYSGGSEGLPKDHTRRLSTLRVIMASGDDVGVYIAESARRAPELNRIRIEGDNDAISPRLQYVFSWSDEKPWFGFLAKRPERIDGSGLPEELLESQIISPSLHAGKYQMHNAKKFSAVRNSSGWTPSSYPNPILNPGKCRIAPLVIEDAIAQSSPQDSLLMCDPDRVLTEHNLERIAASIQNFSFAVPRTNFVPCFNRAVDGKMPKLGSLKGADAQDAKSPGEDRLDVRSHDEERVSPGSQDVQSSPIPAPTVSIQVAVAIVSKIDLQSILRSNSFYAYEDENDMVNDAAQYFARYLHDAWQVGSDTCGQTGILIFLSIKDRVCYVSTGAVVEAVIPWWRLEYVVADMKLDLRRGHYGDAILRAIEDINIFLEAGPPTLSDRAKDFVKRFGVVIAFAFFTFSFALWGEYRDRFRRWQYTERRSKLSQTEKAQAMLLQESYRCKACPICLEEFSTEKTTVRPAPCESILKDDIIETNKEVLSVGSDGLPLKLLRCGHVFDQSCWRCWVNKGQGNPCKCPVCRQDVGAKSPVTGRHRRSATAEAVSGIANVPTVALNRSHSHPNYESVNQTRVDRRQRRRRDRGLRLFHMNYGTLTSQHTVSLADEGSQERRGLLHDIDIPSGEDTDSHSVVVGDEEELSHVTESSNSLGSMEGGAG